MRNKFIMFGCISLISCSILLQDCKGPLSPNDIEAGIVSVTAGCQFISGITQNQTVISICATVEEIAFIVSLFGPFLDTPDVSCTYLPNSVSCLSPSQIGEGIQSVVEQRKARLLRD